MTTTNQRPSLAGPVLRDSVNFRINYTYNGMRAAWTIAATSKEQATRNFRQLLPNAKVTHVAEQPAEW